MKSPNDLDQNLGTCRAFLYNQHRKKKKVEPRKNTHVYEHFIFPKPNLTKIQEIICQSNFTVENKESVWSTNCLNI